MTPKILDIWSAMGTAWWRAIGLPLGLRGEPYSGDRSGRGMEDGRQPVLAAACWNMRGQALGHQPGRLVQLADYADALRAQQVVSWSVSSAGWGSPGQQPAGPNLCKQRELHRGKTSDPVRLAQARAQAGNAMIKPWQDGRV